MYEITLYTLTHSTVQDLPVDFASQPVAHRESLVERMREVAARDEDMSHVRVHASRAVHRLNDVPHSCVQMTECKIFWLEVVYKNRT